MENFPFSWVKVPETRICPSLTPGKIYKVLSFLPGYSPLDGGRFFYISDDNGYLALCVKKGNSLFSDEDWIIVDYQENLEKILE